MIAFVTAAWALDPPHVPDNGVNCLDCHSPHFAAGGKLNIAETNPNVCMSCHTAGGKAEEKPFLSSDQALPGIAGTSHRFDSGPQGHAEPDPANVGPGEMRAAGAFTGRIERLFTVVIAQDGDVGTARFDWLDDAGHGAAGVLVQALVPLADGISVAFSDGAGLGSFVAGDVFRLRVRADLRLPDPADPFEEPLWLALDEGRVSCSTCHDQHSQVNTPADPAAPAYGGPGTGWGRHYQRRDNDANQMCVICHSVRDVTTSDQGSHPVGVDLPDDPEFQSPPGLSLVQGQVYCTTCHSPHFTDSGGANGGAGDGYLLDAAITELCFECHTLADRAGSHFVSDAFLWPGGQYGSSFPANTPERVNGCVNCHWPHGWPDDAAPDDDYPRLWVERYDTDAVTPGADPDDAEDLCFTCHDGSPAGTDLRTDVVANQDANGTVFRTHPIRDSDQLGYPGTDRAVECVSCHNPHQARPDDRLAGKAGIDLAGAPVGYGTANPRELLQYELCFNCHGDAYNAARDANATPATNKRLDFATANSAFHPVAAVGRNQSANLAAQLAPNGLSTSTVLKCTDCHASNRTLDATLAEDSASPTGPHGSSNDWILRGEYGRAYTSENWNPDNAELCLNCHAENELLSRDGSSNYFNDDRDNLHWYHLEDKEVTASCSSCHFNVHSNRTASNTIYQVVRSTGTTTYTSPPAGVKTHLVNFAPDVEHPDGGVPVWEINVDPASSNYLRRRCWISCHGEEMNPEPYEPNGGDDPNPTYVVSAAALLPDASPVGGCAEGGVPETDDAACANGADDDCDGLVDCDDGTCLGAAVCCDDADGDGAFARLGCGGPQDCDDADPAIGGGGAEQCANGVDDDCDGLPDCLDSDCAGEDTCATCDPG
ncbi:MAG: cytochrome c3 family protein [Myxococcota bacterium]